jgi:hypothetical protein
MEKNKIEEWFRREVTKDQKEVLQHKRKVIEEVKKSSIQEFLDKRKVTEEEPKKEPKKENKWSWKKIKNILKY